MELIGEDLGQTEEDSGPHFMDVGSVPDAFFTEDSPRQGVITDLMSEVEAVGQGHAEKYDDLPVRALNLSTLKGWYETNNEGRALMQLSKKYYIKVDENFRMSVDSPNVVLQRTKT